MKESILYSKLQRPDVSGDFVPRERLLRQLDQGSALPLTLISAPAGYGKSTLASHWAAECEYPTVWISLQKRESDLHSFLTYLVAALRSLFPDALLRTESLLDTSPLPSASELALYLQNDLHQIATPFTLFLDDFHLVQRGSPLEDLLDEVLRYPPRSLRLVLLTRMDPGLRIAAMRGSGMVKEIRAADLQFTAEETAAFISGMLGNDIDESTAALVQTKTEGWAVGLRLTGLYLQGQKNVKRSLHQLSGQSRHITEYLLAEVLSKYRPDLVSYLVETSVFDRFCAPLCRHVVQRTDGKPDEYTAVDADDFNWSSTVAMS